MWCEIRAVVVGRESSCCGMRFELLLWAESQAVVVMREPSCCGMKVELLLWGENCRCEERVELSL